MYMAVTGLKILFVCILIKANNILLLTEIQLMILSYNKNAINQGGQHSWKLLETPGTSWKWIILLEKPPGKHKKEGKLLENSWNFFQSHSFFLNLFQFYVWEYAFSQSRRLKSQKFSSASASTMVGPPTIFTWIHYRDLIMRENYLKI